MPTLLWILIFNFIGSFVSLTGGMLLIFKKEFTQKITHLLSSFAAGSLLATALFDLIPEAFEETEKHNMDISFSLWWILIGILFFFLLERVLHWYHHHGYAEHEIAGKPVISLIVIGDTIHNFIDGVAIAATFVSSIPLGIVTAFAVGAHEIPQEIGDFGVMLKKGLSRAQTIKVNIFSALASFLGAILAFYFGNKFENLSVIFLSITAGFFLYIALSDLIPEIHHENKKGLALYETIALLLGIIFVYTALFVIKNLFGIEG